MNKDLLKALAFQLKEEDCIAFHHEGEFYHMYKTKSQGYMYDKYYCMDDNEPIDSGSRKSYKPIDAILFAISYKV